MFLIFIIYVIYRIFQGEELVDVLKLSRSSEPARLTDFPIYREVRYSVHSSHYRSSRALSNLSLSKWRKEREKVPPLPLPVTQRLNSRDAYYQSHWKSGTKSTVQPNIVPSFLLDSPLESPTKPQLVQVKEASRSELSLPIQRLPEILDNKASQRDLTDRWSWTNSQAPSTPRWCCESMASQQSRPKFHNVHSWIDNQRECIDEDQVSLTSMPPILPLREQRSAKAKHTRKTTSASLFTPGPIARPAK